MKTITVFINPLLLDNSSMNKQMRKRKQLEQHYKRKRQCNT